MKPAPDLKVGKALRPGGVDAQTPALGPSGLPADMLRESTRRLGWACLIYAGVFLLAYFVSPLADWFLWGHFPEQFRSAKSIVAILAIVCAVGLYFLTRSPRIPPAKLLDIGLLFEVIGAFGIAMTSIYGAFPIFYVHMLDPIRYLGIPWECAWIIMFPLVAPSTFGKTLIASLAAASMGPLVVLISKATGATSADAPLIFFLNYYLFTSYICAGIAIIGHRIIFGYGARLKKAREIGQYRLVERLGAGGMGEVWRAEHRMLACPAAIKLIRPEALGGDTRTRRQLLRRFEREAQATAALQSVHTIHVFDFGVNDEGGFYYVMELLDGVDLETLVERHGPVPAARTIHFLRQACHSLQEAHARGMIHRDVKPANLYVCRLGLDCDFLKVLDFGLVKSDRSLAQDGPQLTMDSIAIGTPGFMAPEMATTSGRIDGRADIYALGCVGYWLLTGQMVFAGETPLATLMQHLGEDPVPPSQRSEIPVPADLERIIIQCLQKKPDQRPQTAGELDALLADCSTATGWTQEEARRWWDLHGPAQRSVGNHPADAVSEP